MYFRRKTADYFRSNLSSIQTLILRFGYLWQNKQRQQKSKTNLLMEKKKFKRTLSCLFGGRGKVQSRRKKLGYKVQAKSSNLPRRFCSNSVGTPLEFAAFRSGFDAKYSRASAFWFFLSTTMVFTAFRTHFARKNTSIFMLIGSLSRRKK